MSETLHAGTCVAVCGQGVLITGTSGSGKSGLALHLIALGAMLVADDQVLIDDALIARCPPPLRGKIEARGIGILAVETTPSVRLRVVVDMDCPADGRLPPVRSREINSHSLPLIGGKDTPNLAPALFALAKGARVE